MSSGVKFGNGFLLSWLASYLFAAIASIVKFVKSLLCLASNPRNKQGILQNIFITFNNQFFVLPLGFSFRYSPDSSETHDFLRIREFERKKVQEIDPKLSCAARVLFRRGFEGRQKVCGT
jgi:hypothetical protein